jgi:KAP-like P-loop domain-containing protein
LLQTPLKVHSDISSSLPAIARCSILPYPLSCSPSQYTGAGLVNLKLPTSSHDSESTRQTAHHLARLIETGKVKVVVIDDVDELKYEDASELMVTIKHAAMAHKTNVLLLSSEHNGAKMIAERCMFANIWLVPVSFCREAQMIPPMRHLLVFLSRLICCFLRYALSAVSGYGVRLRPFAVNDSPVSRDAVLGVYRAAGIPEPYDEKMFDVTGCSTA